MNLSRYSNEELRIALEEMVSFPLLPETVYGTFGREPLKYRPCRHRRRLGQYIVTLGDGSKVRIPIDHLDNGPHGSICFGRHLEEERKESIVALEAELQRRDYERQRHAAREAELKTTRRYLVSQQGEDSRYHVREFVVEVPPGVDETELNNRTLELLADEQEIQWRVEDDIESIESTDHEVEYDLEDGERADLPVIQYPATEEGVA